MGLMKMMRREPNTPKKRGKQPPAEDRSIDNKKLTKEKSSAEAALHMSDKTIESTDSIKDSSLKKKKSIKKKKTAQQPSSLDQLMNQSSHSTSKAGGADVGDFWETPLAGSSTKKKKPSGMSSSSDHRRPRPRSKSGERSRRTPMQSKSENLSAIAPKNRAGTTRPNASDLSQSMHSKKGMRKVNSGSRKHKVGQSISNTEPHVSKLQQMRANEELENQREAVSKLKQERQEISKAKTKLELKLQKEVRKNDDLNQDVKDLKRKLQTAKARSSSSGYSSKGKSTEELDELTSENAELKLKLKRERRETEQVVFQKDDEIGKLIGKVEKMEAERGADKASPMTSGTSIGRLHGDLTESRARVKDLERKVMLFEKEITSLGQELKRSRETNTVSNLGNDDGSDVENLKNENKELKSKMDFKDETIEHLMEQLKKLKLSRSGTANTAPGGHALNWLSDTMDRSGHGVRKASRSTMDSSFHGMDSNQQPAGTAITAKSAVNDLWNKISPGTLRKTRQVGRAGRNAMAAPEL